MWSDNETLDDCIDYDHLIKAVVSIIDDDRLLPCSVGIFGDWGSGKSSLMKMIEKTLEQREDTLVIRFNGWLFEGYEDAKTVLMSRIVDEIISNRTLTERIKKAAIRLLKKIDVLKATTTLTKYAFGAALGPAGLAGVAAADVLQKAREVKYEDYVKAKSEGGEVEDLARNNIQEFHSNFDELISATGLKKIVVFIDDLDRCSPDTIIGTLEAIKLFLFTKQTAFVIGADERLIKFAVRRRFPEIPGDNTEVGRDYLEKLIQYPIRIPPLNASELTTYVNLLFAELHTDAGEFGIARGNVIEKKSKESHSGFAFNAANAGEFFNQPSNELKEAFLLSAQVVPVLVGGLNGNPRQCKRFLNAMLIRHNMAMSKEITLHKRILAKLMLLEYFKPETFNAFHRDQLEHQGVLSDIGLYEAHAVGNAQQSETDAAKLSPEQKAYLQDEWLKNWFKSEPSLANQNVQPYYYFSRDKLAATGASLQRISPQAQDFLHTLLSLSTAVSNNTLGKASQLSTGDASGIFEAITQRVRSASEQDGENALRRLFSFCEHRTELISQLLTFLKDYPDNELPLVAVTLLENMVKGTEYESAGLSQIDAWSKSASNRRLAKVSKTKLSAKK